MQPVVAPTQPAAGITVEHGQWSAEFLPVPARWMVGAIAGKRFADDEARRGFAALVLAAIEAVDEGQLAYSTCTDGRRRSQLSDGSPVPVREQLVGTDTMCAFVAAEALGGHFYGDDLYKPVEVRIRRVVQHLLDNGLRPTAHIACGAAGGFMTVINRATQFIKDPDYAGRIKRLSGGVYSDTLHYLIVGSYQSRLASGVYDGYRDGLVAEVVQEMVGPVAVEQYDDDGRGVHGHREQLVVYLDSSAAGFAISPNKLLDAADVQVFGVNNGRADKLARIMCGGDSDGINYLTARLAIDDFTVAGHGTLAANIETLLVRRAV